MPMELVEMGLLHLSELPRSWTDPKWCAIRDKFGLNVLQVTELKAEIALQNAGKILKRVSLSVNDGPTAARMLLARWNKPINKLPKDVDDEQWREIQRITNLDDIYITVLMYHIAVQGDMQQKKQKELQIRDGCLMNGWISPVEKGDRSAPHTCLRRRPLIRNKQGLI